jgi:hypothetical protein
MDLFYPESRMKEQFAHSDKYRNKDGNADLYSIALGCVGYLCTGCNSGMKSFTF